MLADHYVLGDVIGWGGMGVVYAAVQRSLDRKVAIKVPRPELANEPAVTQRFRCEALAGSRLNHRNIIRVFDFGNEAGAPYLVMEHVVGPTLAELAAAGPMPTATAMSMVRQIVAGLEDAHIHGVVHADIKCDNILVETLRDGTVVPKLIDFGIARFSDDPGCSAEQISGTPEYIAPEVIRGRRPTFASDVYALGTMLYELITGVVPFSGATKAEIMCRKLEDDLVPMTQRRPDRDIPSELDDLVTAALARNPTERITDAGALGQRLDAITIRETSVRLRVAARTVTDLHSPCARRQRAVVEATLGDDSNAIVVAYLDLARALVELRQLADAVAELEKGIELLRHRAEPGPIWRLLLTLAALYAGKGDRSRARLAAREAQQHAMYDRSSIGQARAQWFCERLAR